MLASGAGALDFVQGDPCQDGDPAWICPTGLVDTPYSIKFPVHGEGAGPPFKFTMIRGTLPTGLTLRSDGVISGTPTEAGGWGFGLQIWDKAGNKGGDNDFVIRVDPRVLLQSAAPGPATIGMAYSHQVTAVMKLSPSATSPPQSPVVWSVAGGTLPPGLTLGANGVISGTPTTAGTYDFAVRGALVDGRADTQSLRITVRAPLVIATGGAAGARSEVGVPYRSSLTASGGSGTYSWSLSGGALPPGVVLAPSGTIAGKPTTAGAYRFTATATDSEGRTASSAGAILVAARLQVTTSALRPAKADRAYRAKLLSSGGVEPRTWRVARGKLPRGLRLSPREGVIAGTPRVAGRYLITLQVRDGFGVTATRTLRLDVSA